MANQAAWIGAGGAILGALISAGVTLYISDGSDRRNDLELNIQAGFEGLATVSDPSARIAQLDILQQLVNSHEVAGWQRLIEDYRVDAEEAQQQANLLNANRARQEDALAGFKAAQTGLLANEISSSVAEAIADAEAVFETQERLLDAEVDAFNSSILAAAVQAEEERKREEAELREAARALQIQLDAQRICQDRNCTSWILP